MVHAPPLRMSSCNFQWSDRGALEYKKVTLHVGANYSTTPQILTANLQVAFKVQKESCSQGIQRITLYFHAAL